MKSWTLSFLALACALRPQANELSSSLAGSKNPTRRSLGEYGTLTLERARQKARQWIELNQAGTDPKVHAERAKGAEIAKQRKSFASVAEDFLKRHVAGQRTAKDTEREIRAELIHRFGSRPITDVSRTDIIVLLQEIADRPAPYYAHLIFGHLRSLFNWAIAVDAYGLENSPCDRLKPSKICPRKATTGSLSELSRRRGNATRSAKRSIGPAHFKGWCRSDYRVRSQARGND